MTKILLAFTLTFAMLFGMCSAANFATELRVVVAAGAPVLNIFVQQGKITPALRDGLILDLTNEAYRIGDMATCFSAIPNGDAQSKLKHLQCVQTLDSAPETKKLLSDFGANTTVANIAADVEAIIQGAIIFYGGQARASARRGGAPLPTTEAELRARVKTLKAHLGQ